jgi:CRP-like cAMP-binding protein
VRRQTAWRRPARGRTTSAERADPLKGDGGPPILALLRDAVGGEATRRRLEPGEAVVRQGDRATALYGVASGRVRLLRHTAEGSTVVAAVAAAGETFAEASLAAGVYHCDAVADLASEVEAFPAAAVRRALAADPALAERWIVLLAAQVRWLRARVELRGIRSARDRVLAYLRQVAPGGGRPPWEGRPLKDLAAEVDLTPEALYRTLAGLERDGAIARSGRSITLRASPGRGPAPDGAAGGGRRAP